MYRSGWQRKRKRRCAATSRQYSFRTVIRNHVCLCLSISFPLTEWLNRQPFSKSCTVVINREKVCIHDETWQRCDVSDHCQLAVKFELIQKQNGHEVKDFVDQIEYEYDKLNGLS